MSKSSRATLSHEMRFDRSKTEVKLRFQLVPRNPFARNEVRSPKTEVKLRFPCYPAKYGKKLRVKASVCKLLCVKAFVCKSVCV